MTKREVARLFRRAQSLLRLDHWDVDLFVDHDQDLSGDDARVFWAFQYDRARVYLSAEWREWDEAKVAGIVLHELGHLVFRDLEVALRDQEEYLGDAYPQFRDRVTHEYEGIVDRYSALLVPRLVPAR